MADRHRKPKSELLGIIYHVRVTCYNYITVDLTRIIQSLYYSPASRCINAWMHSLKKSVKPEIVNLYDLWVLPHKIGGAKVLTWIILRPLSALSLDEGLNAFITRIIQSLYYSPASRCINAWMHSLKKSVKPEIVNRYDLWVLRQKIGGAKVFVNNVQWSDQMM